MSSEPTPQGENRYARLRLEIARLAPHYPDDIDALREISHEKNRSGVWVMPPYEDPKSIDRLVDGAFAKVHEGIWTAAPVGSVPAGESIVAGLMSAADAIEAAKDKPKWLVDRLFPHTGVSLLGGSYGAAKSLLALQACLSVAMGLPCWGGLEAIETGPVLIFGFDTQIEVWGNRLKRMLEFHALPTPDNVFFYPYPLYLDYPDNLEQMRELQRHTGARLTILDMLLTYLGRSSFKDGSDMAPVMTNIRTLVSETSGTALVLHHGNRAGEGDGAVFAGAMQIGGHVDTMFESKITSEEAQIFRLKPWKSRLGKLQPKTGFRILERYEGGPLSLGWDLDMQPSIKVRIDAYEGKLKIKQRMTTDELWETLDESPSRNTRAEDLKRMEGRGHTVLHNKRPKVVVLAGIPADDS